MHEEINTRYFFELELNNLIFSIMLEPQENPDIATQNSSLLKDKETDLKTVILDARHLIFEAISTLSISRDCCV